VAVVAVDGMGLLLEGTGGLVVALAVVLGFLTLSELALVGKEIMEAQAVNKVVAAGVVLARLALTAQAPLLVEPRVQAYLIVTLVQQ